MQIYPPIIKQSKNRRAYEMLKWAVVLVMGFAFGLWLGYQTVNRYLVHAEDKTPLNVASVCRSGGLEWVVNNPCPKLRVTTNYGMQTTLNSVFIQGSN